MKYRSRGTLNFTEYFAISSVLLWYGVANAKAASQVRKKPYREAFRVSANLLIVLRRSNTSPIKIYRLRSPGVTVAVLPLW
jgi:hypothetical protein